MRKNWILCAGLIGILLGLNGVAQSRRRDESRGRPGVFDYYALSLSWSPQYCAQSGSATRDDSQCSPGRRYGFVVHGLWPQYERGWPQFCSTGNRLPNSLIHKLLAIMPNEKLIQHEWEKHGTCSGLAPAEYFQAVEDAFRRLQIPVEYKTPIKEIRVQPDDLKRRFAEANPGLKEESLAIFCSGRFLSEVRVCMTRDLKPHACAGMRDSCRSDSVLLRPIR